MVSNLNRAMKSLSIAPIYFYYNNFKTSLKPSCLQLIHVLPGPEGQSVVRLIVDPEAMSLILAWLHTFVDFDD